MSLNEKLKKNVIDTLNDSCKFQFGNYKSYYQNRNEKRWQDPRLTVLSKHYFTNKKILDIGCNDGSLTLQIAIKYFPQKIIGIDIDYKLISLAVKHYFLYTAIHQYQNFKQFKVDNVQLLEKTQKTKLRILEQQKKEQKEIMLQKSQEEIQQEQNKIFEKLHKLPKSFFKSEVIQKGLDRKQLQKSQNDILEQQIKKSTIDKPIQSIQNCFPKNINFRVENYIQNDQVSLDNEKIDTVLCFSVTKWIHLNYGDEGIMKLFKNIYYQLNHGGIFILEPQDWKSYKKRRSLCPEFQKNYNEIQIKPNNFNQILLQMGFKLIKYIQAEKNQLNVKQIQQINEKQTEMSLQQQECNNQKIEQDIFIGEDNQIQQDGKVKIEEKKNSTQNQDQKYIKLEQDKLKDEYNQNNEKQENQDDQLQNIFQKNIQNISKGFKRSIYIYQKLFPNEKEIQLKLMEEQQIQEQIIEKEQLLQKAHLNQQQINQINLQIQEAKQKLQKLQRYHHDKQQIIN
ncbi:hypothetical protein PPERSA_11423 [Pseudocohnilembus persalinus]|uniref:RNA methyltransferase n=1 Tax=Pseudocohnilembus persalinus TaxID=266149 RepID=A0A0V0QPS9_PSEPJ|nr:hypothetical protein PPERSA_11423 [Pseudocohnilembus persalinus]|eukprot:KRX04299.1 hypothetical protein PPERSA_11423 [Pseudocohnilembus persalinus]